MFEIYPSVLVGDKNSKAFFQFCRVIAPHVITQLPHVLLTGNQKQSQVREREREREKEKQEKEREKERSRHRNRQADRHSNKGALCV